MQAMVRAIGRSQEMRVSPAASLLPRGRRLVPFFHCSHRLRRHSFRVLSMSSQHQQQKEPEVYRFGQIIIDKRQVFFSTNLSFALVNIRPRLAKRFVDLTAEETADLWLAARHIGSKVESYFGASSLTFALQDGPEAGQTVPHVHVHILPRRAGDFDKNDDIYYAIEDKENVLNLDAERRNRTVDEMAEEAEELRKLFPQND
ncbi:Bis(5'-adenosyl)-triphosphatase [Nymphaea thermarum]|nr:Bis(5'-adenosyl)-triphosphatase [Nymphaea thermarum]